MVLLALVFVVFLAVNLVAYFVLELVDGPGRLLVGCLAFLSG